MKNLRDATYEVELLDFDGRYEPARVTNRRPGEAEVDLLIRRP